jgi:uncharacterized membrane protein
MQVKKILVALSIILLSVLSLLVALKVLNTDGWVKYGRFVLGFLSCLFIIVSAMDIYNDVKY